MSRASSHKCSSEKAPRFEPRAPAREVPEVPEVLDHVALHERVAADRIARGEPGQRGHERSEHVDV